MSKVFLLVSFFVTAPAILIVNIVFLNYLSFHKNQAGIGIFNKAKQGVAYAALPSIQGMSKGEVSSIDARIEIIRQFFSKYGSPLEPYAKDVVDTADLYGLDFRLIPAIAMQESNLCKKAPPDSNNCWGFGIYGGKITKFNDYSQAINAVTKTLAKEYKAKGLETPGEIMKKYTPSNNGDWAKSVTHFMNVLR